MTEVNIKNQTVSIFNEDRRQWETCSFYEAGLAPNGEPITDKDDIIEHLEENRGCTEIEFVG